MPTDHASERGDESLPDLAAQMETATLQRETAAQQREAERAQEIVAGLVIGIAVVVGFILGLLVPR